MPNDIDSSGKSNRGTPPSVPVDVTIPPTWVLEDIGHGFALLQPPATLDDVPFPPEDPDRQADYDWARRDPDVRARHGGLVVAVRHKQVWGAGRSHVLAGREAARQPDCPKDLVYVYVWPTPPEEGNGKRTA
jgi:hypothetical protein